uniref:NADH-ubiquinone oxidoreductase chain 3 n=1 Tax=Haemodracon trachyrhinus TaxID=1216929 RepID=A0A7R7G2W6_9SAUR|nr:NADH dehydrogenase subunit 3 [Haemodracon trachyrhinus]
MKLTLYILIVISLTLLIMAISFYLPQTNPDTEKSSPYECGFDPLGSARLPFSLRFFLVAILFLLFDLEIALLLPTPWAINSTTPAETLTWTILIILLLTIGLIYEWTQGGLEWAE